jgi:alpha-glucosidase (family GH31 glycosyl hydrolase)
VTIGGAEAQVRISLSPFSMSIVNAAGRTVLQTLDPQKSVAGDAVGAYTPIGATHHSTIIDPPILVEGWDHVEGADGNWVHATKLSNLRTDPMSASFDLSDDSTPPYVIHVQVSVIGSTVSVDGSVTPGAFAPQTSELPSGDPNQMGMAFAMGADEHVFGLGERFVTVDHRGQHYESWVEEGGIGDGEGKPPAPDNPSPNGPNMTHAPIPFMVSTAGYGLFLDSTYRNGFHLGDEDPSAMRIYAESPVLHYKVFVHDDPLESVGDYTALTGRAHAPAPWVFGPRRRIDRFAQALGMPEDQALRLHHVPTTAADDATHFLPQASQTGEETNIAEWTEELHRLGFKSIAYYNCYVSATLPAGASMLAYGREHGLFVKTADGLEFDTFMTSGGGQQVATIDLTNPEAVTWYQSLLQRALDLGYDGWMLDFGEYLPQHAQMFDGRTGWEMHNAFPVVYQRVAYDYLKSVRGDDFMFFARAGYVGSQATIPILWSGDPAASFDDVKGLPANVRAGINAGISGIPFWGSDISGYTCLNQPQVDRELYLRWAEFGALSPDMHSENACNGLLAGAPPKWDLWSDDETISIYARYASLHTRLLPYLYTAAKEAEATGKPIMRHPMLVHPTEPEALKAEFDYYFGPSLYVAPVVVRDARTRDVWLPPGQWVDWWSMQSFTGGAHVSYAAAQDVLPLFLKSGGIVAMLDPSVDTLAPATTPRTGDWVSVDDVQEVLDVRAAIDPTTGSGEAHLADGSSFYVGLTANAVTLPKEYATAASEAALATCSQCGLIDAPTGGLQRVRATTELTDASVVAAGGLLLRAYHLPRPKRIRWDVATFLAPPMK